MKETREQKTILRVVVLTAFLTTFMGSALNLSIPDMEEDFGAGAALIGWIVTAYTLSVAAMSVPFGKIADVTGRRRILILGIGVFAAMSVCCSFSSNIWVLLAFRILQGVGAAMIFATNNAILIGAYPAEQRGRVLGLSSASVYVGLSLGPVAGGLLNHYIHWRSIFIVVAAVAAAILLVTVRGIPKTAGAGKSVRIDLPGNLLYIFCITLFLYGLTNLSLLKFGWAILLLGLLTGAAFVFVESRAEDPVMRITMFSRDPAFTFSNLAALLNYGATFAISYLMSIYLQVVMGFSSGTAGLILIVQPAIQAMFSPAMGRLSDRIPPYKLASGGMGLCAAALAMFYFLSETTPLWYIFLTLAAAGFGFAVFASPNNNAIMACVEKEEYSLANSVLATMRTVGQSSSMAIVTVVVGVILGSSALDQSEPAKIVETMHISFAIFFCLCVLGIFLSLKRKE